jgi:hypothetical protein
MSGFIFSQFSKQTLCLCFELVLKSVASPVLYKFPVEFSNIQPQPDNMCLAHYGVCYAVYAFNLTNRPLIKYFQFEICV